MNSMEMIYDTPVQNFTSDSPPGPLNTPPPPIDIEEDHFTELFQNISISSNVDLLLKTETIISDVQTLKKSAEEIKRTLRGNKKSLGKFKADLRKNTESIGRIEETLNRQEQSNQSIISMLEKLIQSSTSTNKNTHQRFVRSQTSEVPLSLPERSRSREEIPIDEPVSNGIENNQSHHISSLPSETNVRTDAEEYQNPNRLTTTNELKSNSRLPYPPDEIDKIRSEKNRGKIQIGQWCYEINVGTTDDAPSLNTSTEPKNPSQNKENSINCQLSRHVTTTTTICKDASTKLCFLHPLKRKLSEQTDRGTILTDCRGNKPILLVCGDNLPRNTQIQIAAIFSSPKGCFHSTYRFRDNKGGYEHYDFRPIKKFDTSPQIFELNNLKLCKRCNNNMKNGETFTLKPYPSGEAENTMIESRKQLSEEYNFTKIKLAIRCFQNETLLLDGYVFYSNLLSASKKLSNQYSLQISTIYPCQKTISFNDNKQCPMGFLTKIPEPFHCTLASGYKWIELSVISHDSLNPMYAIDTGNDEKKNPNYINIKHDSFKIFLKIVKQTSAELMNNENMHDEVCKSQYERQIENLITQDINTNDIHSILAVTDPNRFHIQIQLLHSEVAPNESSKEYYENCAPWKSEEFIENIVQASLDEQGIISEEQEIGRNTGQKRTIEVICDDSQRSETYKALRVNEQFDFTLHQYHEEQNLSTGVK